MVLDMREEMDRCLKANVVDDNPLVEFVPDTGEDSYVKRLADGSFALATYTSGILIGDNGFGNTASRPTGLGASDAMTVTYYDTDLGYPIFWNGSDWSNFSGFSGV
jgi:hypothetical protein